MSDSKNLKLSGDSRFLQKVALKHLKGIGMPCLHRYVTRISGGFYQNQWCKPTALYSNWRTSSLYIELHNGYRRTTTTSQAHENWSVFHIMVLILSYVCPRAPAMWYYRCALSSTLSFMYSCVLHVSQYIGFKGFKGSKGFIPLIALILKI